ncbi:Ankyrin repeat-containing protein [Escovopsis weberi]|uniref:Ankyrin repeat-containing protein n=1 Tax=Escovopsis weberi TaxID=150374 RepID=A0A0M8N6S2_ESCWE|nr:Ankyrin repeat-containing protein [Escovopsis weberi]
MADQEYEPTTQGASVRERLIEACRRDNVELLHEVLAEIPDANKPKLLNDTTTVMGNHLYHEAASHGNYDVIDVLLDQEEFECDPVNRIEGDTPLHSAIRWINSEPPAQRPFGRALVAMMLEAGSDTRVRNRGGLTPFQLVDPANPDLRRLIQEHEYASQNAGDFASVVPSSSSAQTQDKNQNNNGPMTNGNSKHTAQVGNKTVVVDDQSSDEDAEFSGSDEDERAEWERRRRNKAKGKR